MPSLSKLNEKWFKCAPLTKHVGKSNSYSNREAVQEEKPLRTSNNSNNISYQLTDPSHKHTELVVKYSPRKVRLCAIYCHFFVKKPPEILLTEIRIFKMFSKITLKIDY